MSNSRTAIRDAVSIIERNWTNSCTALDGIRPLLIGQHIRDPLGHMHEIVHVYVHGNEIRGYGVRVNPKTGRLGRRQFSIDVDTRFLLDPS